MPNQIVHVALAAKVFTKTFSQFDRGDFFIGTVFPDIRYLGVIDRDKTHFNDVTLDSVLAAKTSFEAGFLFHNLVDRIFNDRVVSSLSPVEGFDDVSSIVKMLADQLFYNKINDWPEIVSHFDNIISEELESGINESDLIKWHEMVKGIFIEAPTDTNRSKFMADLNFSKDQIDYYNRSLSKIRDNRVITEILLNFYDNFSG